MLGLSRARTGSRQSHHGEERSAVYFEASNLATVVWSSPVLLMGKCSEVQGCLAVGSPGCPSRFDPISSGASGQGVTIGMCGEETI